MAICFVNNLLLLTQITVAQALHRYTIHIFLYIDRRQFFFSNSPKFYIFLPKKKNRYIFSIHLTD